MTPPPGHGAPAPYVGLRPFEFHEAALFYGRGEHIAEMVRTLRQRHFLAVIGSSGSGKSSLVRAGLLPAIAAGFMNGDEDELDWRFVILRPGLDPYENLVAELLPQLVPGPSLLPDLIEFRRRTLRGGPRGLVEAVADSLLPEPARLVVLIDQFEEIFRFLERGGPGEPEGASSTADRRNAALAFVDMLLATAAERDPRVYVVLTMRSEYLGDCEAFLGLSAAIAKAQFLTPRMTREQIQDVIDRPIEAVGGRIEPQVVTTLLNALGTAQDQLPRVEHALLRMWDRAARLGVEERAAPVFTLEDYRAVGGFETALDLHGEQLFYDLGPAAGDGPPSERQRVAERLFRSLAVRTAQGRLVRRLSSLGEVASIAGASEELVAEVVEHFRQSGCNFLVATPAAPLTAQTCLDISHESLFRQWKRMGEWVGAETLAAAELQRLVRDAESWNKLERGLLRQPELGLFARWRREVPSSAWALRYVTAEQFALADQYLEAGAGEERAEVARKKAEAREKERERRHRFKVVVALLVVAVVAACYGLWTAYQAKQDADRATRAVEQAKREADRNTKLLYEASQADVDSAEELTKDDDWIRQLVFLERAGRSLPDNPDASAKLWAKLRYGLASRAPLIRWLAPMSNHAKLAWSPNGECIATVSESEPLRLWDAGKGNKRPELSALNLTLKDAKGDVRFSADKEGEKIILRRSEDCWSVISLKRGEVLFSSELDSESPNRLRGEPISPDGTRVVSRRADGLVRITETLPGQSEIPLIGSPPQGGKVIVNWSPAGDRIALSFDPQASPTGGQGPPPIRTIDVYDASNGKPLRDSIKPSKGLTNFWFDSSGKYLLVKFEDDDWLPLFEIGHTDVTGSGLIDDHRATSAVWIHKDGTLLWNTPKGSPVPGESPQYRLVVHTVGGDEKDDVELPVHDAWQADISDDDSVSLVLRNDGFYQAFDLKSGTAITALAKPTLQGTAFTYLLAPDSRSCASAADAGLVRWDFPPIRRTGHLSNAKLPSQPPQHFRNADIELGPPKVMEAPIRKLVLLVIGEKLDNRRNMVPISDEERIRLRNELEHAELKDPRWKKLLDWWLHGRSAD